MGNVAIQLIRKLRQIALGELKAGYKKKVRAR
jgi:hypothetical protein